MSAKIGSFEKNGKTYKTIDLMEEGGGKFRFSFGVTKAKMILNHIEDIEKFVSDSSAN